MGFSVLPKETLTSGLKALYSLHKTLVHVSNDTQCFAISKQGEGEIYVTQMNTHPHVESMN